MSCFSIKWRSKYSRTTTNINQNKYLIKITSINDNRKMNEINAEETQYLYVILPYFNFCNSTRRKKLFIEFTDRIKKTDNIKIVIAEATIDGNGYDLDSQSDDIFMHLGFKLKHQLWCKENIINLAIEKLPSSWEYVAWIDADITFLNDTWVFDTLEELKRYDFIQLFQTAVHLGPENESFKIDKSFGYMHQKSNTDWIPSAKYGFWHCGFAWACTKQAYTRLNGLIDYAILGASDHHMALAFIQKVKSSYPGGMHKEYIERLHDFQDLVRIYKISLGYIPGTILHHWHGRLEDRKYVERWDIFTKHNFNPAVDLIKTEDGLIQLSEIGERMEEDLKQYFIDRNEDNMIA